MHAGWPRVCWEPTIKQCPIQMRALSHTETRRAVPETLSGWHDMPWLTARMCPRRQGGTYMVTLTVTDWLAQTAGASWTFVKAATALPLVQLVGGAQQSFTISQGLAVPVQIFLQSVCPGAPRCLCLGSRGAGRRSLSMPSHMFMLAACSHRPRLCR